MTNEQLSASLSYLGDELLAECGARRQRPKRSWRTALIKAACIALVLFSGIYVAGRFDYSLGAGCASSPGTIADGRYYYHVRHSGVWCYDPAMGTSERVLSTFWYDGYAVNGYGIYYLRGETLYVQVHETGERIKLYTAPQDCTRLFFSLLGDGRIDVRLRSDDRGREHPVWSHDSRLDSDGNGRNRKQPDCRQRRNPHYQSRKRLQRNRSAGDGR